MAKRVFILCQYDDRTIWDRKGGTSRQDGHQDKSMFKTYLGVRN